MSENLTPEVLADLKAKALKATPGPWFADTRFGCEISGNEDGDADDHGRLVVTVDHVCSTEDSKRPEDDRAYIIAAQPARVLSLLAALEEAEGRIEDLSNKLDDERENYGNAEAEAKDDAATIAAMVKALTDPRGEPEDYDPWPIQRAEDLMRAHLANQATLSALQQENERLREERGGWETALAEATNWGHIVDRHGTDNFDALADAWLAMEAIKRTHNAVASVFSKWASEDLMVRFRQHMSNAMHLAFVEGCLVGVRAEMAKTALQAPQSQGGEADDR